MSLILRIQRFLVPWLAFAVLGGVGGAIVGGVLVSVMGLAYGVITLAGATAGGQFWPSVVTITQSFPNFALIEIITAAFCFAVGFALATISALVGGGAGLIWGLAALFGCTFFTFSFNQSPHDPFGFFVIIPAFIIAAVGMVVPAQLLETKEPRFSWDGPIRGWLRSTWLLHPPQLARLSAIALPIAFCLCLDIHYTLPIYRANPNYAARLGQWPTWQSGTSLAQHTGLMRGFSCQSNLKQIMLGVLQYQEDYDGYYPPVPSSAKNGTAAAILPYVRSTQVFQCPSEFYMFDVADPENPDFASGDYTDYWFNARLLGFKQTNLTGARATVTFGDGNTGAGEANAAYSLRNIPSNFPPLRRHLNGGNYAFADGHVKWMLSGKVSNSAKSSTGITTMNP